MQSICQKCASAHLDIDFFHFDSNHKLDFRPEIWSDIIMPWLWFLIVLQILLKTMYNIQYKICLIPLSWNYAKIKETNRPWPKSIQFWKWSGHISKPNLMPFPQHILQKMPETLKFDLFHFLRQNCIKISKVNKPWPKSNQLWRWLEYTRMPNLKPFLSCFLKIISGNLSYKQTANIFNLSKF